MASTWTLATALAAAALALALLAAALLAPAAVASSGGVALQDIGSFASPLYVTAPAGDRDRVFVVEQGGTVRVLRNGKRLERPFLDIRSKTHGGGEQGLLSIAFAPDYQRSRRLYVDYTDNAGNSRVVEYKRSRRSADRVDHRTARQVLSVRQPEPNHNGGQLQFGPDGLLYIGLGDGGGGGDQHGSRGNGQNLRTLLGKILRIDPRKKGKRRYTVPRSNPFSARRGARREIYVYGLRNPWRFSFDRETGDLVIGDVGQSEFEEIDFLPRGAGAGANLGWRAFEGDSRYDGGLRVSGDVKPVTTYSHEDGCSVTGGYVVRDPDLPALAGRYLYGDYCEGFINDVSLSSGGASGNRSAGLRRVGQLTSFGEDARGRVYVVSGGGPVYRVVAK